MLREQFFWKAQLDEKFFFSIMTAVIKSLLKNGLACEFNND